MVLVVKIVLFDLYNYYNIYNLYVGLFHSIVLYCIFNQSTIYIFILTLNPALFSYHVIHLIQLNFYLI